nr:hypothetical protein [Tanacetum cinerariifolium]
MLPGPTTAKANESPIWAAGRLNTRDKTRNLSLNEITDKKVPVPIRFEVRDKQLCLPVTMQLIDLATSGRSLGTQFDLRPHMESPDWTEINAGIQQHLQKANIARAAQNRQNQAKNTVISRQGSRSLARLRDEMFESGGANGSGGCGDDEEGADDQDDEDEDGDGDT